MKNQSNTKIAIIVILVISLLVVGIGFAAFSTNLSIFGTANVSSGTWNIYFSNIERDDTNSTSGIGTTLPKIGNNTNAGSNTVNTKIDSFNVNFTQPNQKVVYIATVTNGGTYNAKLTVKNVGTPSCTGTGGNASTDASNVCSNLTYTVTGPEVNSILNAGSTATYTITIQYNDISDASLLPKANVSITIPASTFTYTQDSSSSGSGSSGTGDITLLEHITDLYTDATKTEVVNNSITYNYATSVNLMNDRLGSMDTGIDEGNIRYYGSGITSSSTTYNEPNNYIYFNCDTYPDTNCEVWRIIGVFDGKVKLIRSSSVGTMPYDYDTEDTYLTGLSSTTESSNTNNLVYTTDNDYKVSEIVTPPSAPSSISGENDWSSSSLQKILNNFYYNRTNYSGNSSYTFSDIGIKESTRSMIVDNTYNITGGTSANYANSTFVLETGYTAWTGKIAISDISDYAYATDLSQCTSGINGYSDNTCRGNDWMWYIMTGATSYDSAGLYASWTLNPSFFDSKSKAYWSWLLVQNGALYSSYSPVEGSYKIFPILYLDPDLILDGTHIGSSSDPYRIAA